MCVCERSLLIIPLVIVSHCCRFVAAPCLCLFTEEKISNCIFSLVFIPILILSFFLNETLVFEAFDFFRSIILKSPLIE